MAAAPTSGQTSSGATRGLLSRGITAERWLTFHERRASIACAIKIAALTAMSTTSSHVITFTSVLGR